MRVRGPLSLEMALVKLRAQYKTAKRSERFVPFDYQRRPPGNWAGWCFKGARASGKTLTGGDWCMEELREKGPEAWVGVFGPTTKATRKVCFIGPSGLWTKYHDEFVDFNKSDLILTHRRGGHVWGFGAENPEFLEGQEFTRGWFSELTNWTYPFAFQTALLCIRRGEDPRWFADYVPKKRQFVRDLEKRAAELGVVITTARTDQNLKLSKHAHARFRAMFAGTRLEGVMLRGEDEHDVEGALFQQAWIDDNRVTPAQVPELITKISFVDPSATSGPTSDETSDTVAGLGVNMHYYVFKNRGYRLPPLEWGRRVVRNWKDGGCGELCVEQNTCGEMGALTIRTAAEKEGVDPDSIPIYLLPTTKSKTDRAASVAAYYQAGRVHHVGLRDEFVELEDQLTTFPVENEHDDRLDSDVLAIQRLALLVEQRNVAVPDLDLSVAEAMLDGFGRASPW